MLSLETWLGIIQAESESESLRLIIYQHFNFFRNWKEESDQEFVALCALLLCGDLQLKQDTFQAITNKHEVSQEDSYVIFKFI